MTLFILWNSLSGEQGTDYQVSKSDPQTQVASGILRCPGAFSQVPGCWYRELWCPAAPAIRDRPVPDSLGHLWWDLTQAGFNLRSDTAPEEEANLLWGETPVDRGEDCRASALTLLVARTPSVTDPFPVPNLDILPPFLALPVLYSNSAQNKNSVFRASAGLLRGSRRHFCGARRLSHLLRRPRHGWGSHYIGLGTAWTENAMNMAQCIRLSPLTPRDVIKQHWQIKPAVCLTYLLRVQLC